MIIEWTGRMDRVYQVRRFLFLIIVCPLSALFIVLIAFGALLFVESVLTHGLWQALVIAGEIFAENHGPGL